MPTYDYECAGCGHRFEKFQPISANPSRKCPKCGRQKLQRLIGAGAGIIFKGSGFYETDYRRKPSPDAPSKSDAKAEPKPDAKSEPPKNEPPKSDTPSKPKKE